MSTARILEGDVRDRLRELPDASVQTVITSPPYWGLRDYGHDGQIGLEQTPEQYVEQMVAVFREVRRVLRKDGTLWLNLGDSYAGSGKGAWGSDEAREANRSRVKETYVPTRAESPLAGKTPDGLKPKDLVGIPWRVAFALQADGWYLRQDIIWAKPNPMPESVRDRCTKSHEYLFLLTKSARYFYDAEACAEPLATSSVERLSQDIADQRGSDRVPGKTNGTMKAVGKRFPIGGVKYGDSDDPKHQTKSGNEWVPSARGTRNRRSVWTITTKPFRGAHFAVMPEALVEPCVLAGSAAGDVVLDPFAGSGTAGVVALRHGRQFVGIELNPRYAEMARRRIADDAPLLNEVEASAG